MRAIGRDTLQTRVSLCLYKLTLYFFIFFQDQDAFLDDQSPAVDLYDDRDEIHGEDKDTVGTPASTRKDQGDDDKDDKEKDVEKGVEDVEDVDDDDPSAGSKKKKDLEEHLADTLNRMIADLKGKSK